MFKNNCFYVFPRTYQKTNRYLDQHGILNAIKKHHFQGVDRSKMFAC